MSTYDRIQLNEFKEAYFSDDRDFTLIDVRFEKEYNKSHVKGAINIPFDQRGEFEKLDKNNTYYLYCRVGGKSSMTAFYLKSLGFKKVYCINAKFNELQSSFN